VAKLRTAVQWLTGEWPVPRWILLLFILGALADLTGH